MSAVLERVYHRLCAGYPSWAVLQTAFAVVAVSGAVLRLYVHPPVVIDDPARLGLADFAPQADVQDYGGAADIRMATARRSSRQLAHRCPSSLCAASCAPGRQHANEGTAAGMDGA